MNKTDLIDHVAAQTDMSKAAAGRAIDALIGGIKDALCDGGSVTLVGSERSWLASVRRVPGAIRAPVRPSKSRAPRLQNSNLAKRSKMR